MQDEVRDKSVALTIKVGKAGGRLTAGLLKWAIRKYLAQAQNPKIHHGKQTVQQYSRQWKIACAHFVPPIPVLPDQ